MLLPVVYINHYVLHGGGRTGLSRNYLLRWDCIGVVYANGSKNLLRFEAVGDAGRGLWADDKPGSPFSTF